RTMRLRQLAPFWSAIFFLFAITGFVSDVLLRGRFQPPVLVFVLIGSGLLGVASVYGEINQRRRLSVIAFFAYVLLVTILSRIFPHEGVPDPRRLTLDAGGIIASLGAAYW